MKPMIFYQRGATLLVSLIFLVLMTLFALTAFNMGKTSLQAVGNMQQRNQTLVVAQEAINDAISSTKFIDTPAAVLSNNSNELKVDINGDGTNDVEVKVKQPTCIKSQILKTAVLLKDAAPKDEDLLCTQGQAQNFGVQGVASGDSLCAEGLWELEATAKDLVSDVTVTVTQGVGVRVAATDLDATCK